MSTVKRYKVTQHPEFDDGKVVLAEEHDRVVSELQSELEKARRAISKLTEQRNQLAIDNGWMSEDLEKMNADIAAIEKSGTK